MAEILCGVLSGGESSAVVCEASSRAARRRRMDFRRFKIVSGVATGPPHVEPARKRRKLDLNVAAAEEKTSDVGSTLRRQAGRELLSASDQRCPGYGMTSVCGRRREMEDAVTIKPEFHGRGLHFFGVFDGHGCSHVAVSCKNRMHEIVAGEAVPEAEEADSTKAVADWKGVMKRSFDRMDKEVRVPSGSNGKLDCRCELQANKCDHVGSTAVVAVIAPDQIVVGNCGDSRAVLSRGGVAVPLSSDHKPDRPDELKRIQALGGKVIYWDGARVQGFLAMSRAIGDNHLKPYVTSEPEVTVSERTDDDECLIIASDGLWDVVSNETACEVARMCLRGAALGRSGTVRAAAAAAAAVSEEEKVRQGGSERACVDAAILLTKLALARGTADNVSVVVVDLRRRRGAGSLL